MKKFKFKEAIEQYEACINLLHEGSYLAKDALAKIKYARSKEREFYKQLKAKNLSEANQRRMREILLEANALFLEKKYKQAIELFEIAVNHLPVEANVYFSYGLASLALGKKEKAKRAFLKALALDPRNKNVLFRLVEVFFKEENYAPIQALVNREIGLLKADLSRFQESAQKFLRKGLYDGEALEKEKISRVKQQLGHLFFINGKVFFKMKKDHKAIKALKTSIMYRPMHIDTRILLGRSLERKKMLLSSSFAFEKVLTILRSAYKAQIRKGNELLEQGENEALVALGVETAKQKEKMGIVYYLLGRSLYKRGLTRQAITMLKNSSEFNPDFVDSSFYLSQLLAREGEISSAIDITRNILRGAKPGTETARLAVDNLKILLNLSVEKALKKRGIFSYKKKDDDVRQPPVALKDYPSEINTRKLERRLSPVVEKLKRAQILHKKGKLEKARELYLNILEMDGSTLEAFKGLADISFNKKDFKKELFYLEKAIALVPSDFETRLNYSYCLLNNNKDLEKALRISKNLVSDKAKNPDALHTYGWALFKNGFIDESISAFQQTLLFVPEYAIAKFNLATAYYLNGELSLAASFFKQLLGKSGFEKKSRIFLALIALKKKDSAAAIEHFGKAKELVKNKPVLSKYLEKVIKKIETAKKLGKQPDTIELERPSDAEKWVKKAENYYGQGIYPRAVDTLQFALKKDPKSFTALKLMGRIYFNEKFYKKAIHYWLAAVAVNSQAYELFMGLGKCFYKIKKYPEAFEFFSRAYALEQLDPETSYYLGLIKIELKDQQAAEKFLRQSLKLNSNYGKTHLMLGVLLMKRGKLVDARNEFLKARAAHQSSNNVRALAWQKILEVEATLYREKKGPFKKAFNYVDELMLKQKEEALPDLKAIDSRFTASPTRKIFRAEKVEGDRIENEIKRYHKLEGLKIREPSYIFKGKKAKKKKKKDKLFIRKKDPADAGVLLGNKKALEGRLEAALKIYNKAQNLSNRNTELFFNRGFVQTNLLKYSSAFNSFQKILEQKGNEGLGFNALGILLWLSGDGSRALRTWRTAAKYRINIEKPNILLDYSQAWSNLLDVNPVDPDALLNLAMVQLFRGESGKANANLEKILKFDPYRNDVKFYAGMAKIISFLSNRDFFLLNRAKAQYNEILDLDPGFPQVKKLLFIIADLKAQSM
ncbi:tetratricopeptide repeat protein [Candidatus Riflebacteria bacterium]